MKTRNGISYDYKIAIKYNGILMGYRLYLKGVNMFNSDRFVGYLWTKKAQKYFNNN